jgi:hypothetical protein
MAVQFLLVGVVAIGSLTFRSRFGRLQGRRRRPLRGHVSRVAFPGAFAAPQKEVCYEPDPVSFLRFSSCDVATASR